MSFINASIHVKGPIVELTINEQNGYLTENWYSSEKVEINNSAHIELGQNFIFLLGRDKRYGNKATRKFACHFSAIVYAHKIVQALEELNQAYETNKLSIRPEP